MINGCAAIGVFPNQTLYLPPTPEGKDVTVVVQPSIKSNDSIAPQYTPTIKRRPVD